MSGSVSSEQNAEPNLVPILDMVFQLITFFMLVINFKAQSLDLLITLPVVGTARPIDVKGQADLLVLNVNKEGDLKIYGNLVSDVEGYVRNEGSESRKIVRRTKPDVQRGDELPTTIVIRADKDTPFAKLDRVIKTCVEEGFRNYSLKAMTNAP